MKARDIRVKFLGHPSKRKLSTPDAIHLATAMIYKADQFWTFDDGKKNPKYLGLLELDGHEWLDKLAICRPTIENPELPLEVQQKGRCPCKNDRPPHPMGVKGGLFPPELLLLRKL